MNISREEILHISKLASINLSDEEIDKYTKDMEEIIGFANTISNVDTEQVGDFGEVAEQVNVFRKDEVQEFEDKEALMQNAPSVEDGMFHLPSVI